MKRNAPPLVFLSIGLVGIAAAALLVWATPYGAGVSRDSTTYIGAAKSLLSGEGYSYMGSPITHFPPGYPIALAAAGLLVNDLVRAARFLNAVFFGINMGLIALAVYGAAERRFWTMTCAMAFFLSSTGMITVHANAWSEPLFMAFSLASILLLSLHAAKPSLVWLAASALSLGFAIITRYIGAAFLPAAAAMVFITGWGQSKTQRIRNTLIYAALACVPPGGLFVRNILAAGSAANRSFAFHPVPLSEFASDFYNTMLGFLVPGFLPGGVRLAVLILLAAYLITLVLMLVVKHRNNVPWRSPTTVIIGACFLFVLSYFPSLFLSISFVDASTPVDTRLLSPMIAILIPGVFLAVWKAAQILKKPALWWGFVLFLALLVPARAVEAARMIDSIRTEGRGYTSRLWRSSESIEYLKSLASDVKVYSNGMDAIFFITGKETLSIPAKQSPLTLEVNLHYEEELQAMCSDIQSNGALLVYFERIGRWYLPTQTEVRAACALSVLEQFSDGAVYGEAH